MSYYPLMGCQEYAGFCFVPDNMGSPADHEKIRSLIEAEIIEVEATIASLEKALEPRESDCGIGRMLNPETVPGTAAAAEALHLAEQRLQKLESARERLNDPDFGICQVCGNMIPAERLLLVPETRVCAPCKGAGGTGR